MNVSDIYAAVDKSKKTKRNQASTQPPPLSLDPVTDLYSVVDKKRKPKNEDYHGAMPIENLYCNTGTASESTKTGLHDSFSGPIYHVLECSPDYSTKKHKTPPQHGRDFPKQRGHDLPKQHGHDLPKSQVKSSTAVKDEVWDNKLYIWIFGCFTFFTFAIVATAVAAMIAVTMAIDLHSELSSVINFSTSVKSTSEGMPIEMKTLEPQIDKLRTDLHNYVEIVHGRVKFLNHSIADGVLSLDNEINTKIELLRNLQNESDLLTLAVNASNGIFRNQKEAFSQNFTSDLQNLTEEVTGMTTNQISILETNVNMLAERVASGIQNNHTFDSCDSVSVFPIPLPSGMYMIRLNNSIVDDYCSTTIAFSCNGTPGRWRRIAYMNTDNEPVICPEGFQVRSYISNPPLCRLKYNDASCSAVIYSSIGMSYSHVCGTVRIYPLETPDGFESHNKRISRNNQSVNQNYVDGVSLTHGTSPNRTHIWTYAAAILIGDDTDRCTTCDKNKPFYIGTNFTCTAGHCNPQSCFDDAIWTDGLPCVGNETFYRQLSESTTDNIEMRVCRDQGRWDEDILISYVEIFVL